ncbi:hypothetical protein PVA19_10490 [Agrobacterium sp. CNPSo 3708]|nr:hypothetical protein [Agrobacterium sp. CNPSo 3708]MDD1498838.1 hypothetical protein [Agrobacterium sp. CNPSo 3708]
MNYFEVGGWNGAVRGMADFGPWKRNCSHTSDEQIKLSAAAGSLLLHG